MNQEEKQRLFQEQKNKYPELLSNLKSWGVGPGWYPLLTSLFETMDFSRSHSPFEIQSFLFIVQIKEKFGALRVYLHQTTPEMDGAIMMAEIMSLRLCEECGAPGSPRGGNWIRTLCDIHEEERVANKK